MYRVFVMIMAGNTVKDMMANFRKLEKFEGHDFKRWQKKMHFLLTTLKVVYVLTTPMPELVEDATVEAIKIKAKWENDDYICRGHILNGMSDSLFNVYTNVESAKELWDSLESKYMTEDSSSKKFLVDAVAWWIDFGSTTHVCKDRCWFKTFEPVEDRYVLYMGDEHFAPIHGKGSVALEFSSGKTVTLFNVFSGGNIYGCLLTFNVDDTLFSLVKNSEAWNSLPWGEHLWCHLYDEIKNLKERHGDEHYYGLFNDRNYVPTYTLSGFVFAFQVLAHERSDKHAKLKFTDEFSSMTSDLCDSLNSMFADLIESADPDEDIAQDYLREEELRLCLEGEKNTL
uniref:Zinc finger, CCHC-type n=1 Tax=Tanacetum cinerariifolium TaxID=118510 RepID=A0A6L2L1H6_TANCI|nr:zinc finger, CCHC-type [Tanacetum cinerariifolium]